MNTANNALTTQHSSAIGYAFHIPIVKTAITANIFHMPHINPDIIIGYQVLIIEREIFLFLLLIKNINKAPKIIPKLNGKSVINGEV